MDFDLISFIIGAAGGVLVAGSIGRAKFNEVQDKMREIRFDAEMRVEEARAKLAAKRQPK